MATTYNLILVQNFYLQMDVLEKISLFLELIWAHFGAEPTQGLNDTVLTAGGKYHINFMQFGKSFVLSLRYSRSNIFLFVNATKNVKFKR